MTHPFAKTECVGQERKDVKIAILPGDGIGPEIMDEAVRVLNALDENFEMEWADVGGAG